MNIIFEGMPLSGKTTFARFVSKLLNMELIDTDEAICKKYGASVSEIFEKYGESFFRDVEEYEVLSASQKSNVIISLGGGVVMNKKAMTALKKSGLVVYLCLTPEELLKRIDKSDDTRPLLFGEDKDKKIEKLYEERGKLYLEYADIVLHPSGIEKSRNIENSELSDKLGALYVELFHALEKRVYGKH